MVASHMNYRFVIASLKVNLCTKHMCDKSFNVHCSVLVSCVHFCVSLCVSSVSRVGRVNGEKGTLGVTILPESDDVL